MNYDTMSTMGEKTPPVRPSVPTPFVDHDDTIVMVAPSAMTRVACLDAAIEIGARPVQVTPENTLKVVATVRPLVIVVEESTQLSSSELTDLAVSVGAQLLVVAPDEVGLTLAERVKLAGRASRILRSRSGE
ncbi:MAG: hypothetical protein BWY17_03068 [Deltaproteobacteria bacterium ADurb.Bin207]|jgi:hypothetical protein|nr:MAG: hypothetical protein BWY17_03068 [Deltaproteobacteria bacterium ADurb.Bin207]